MAVVSSSAPSHMQQVPSMQCRPARVFSNVGRGRIQGGGGVREIEEEAVETPDVVEEEERMYVAVPKEFREGKSAVVWALRNTARDTRIFIVHVHRPAQMIPMMGGKFPANKLKDEQVIAYRQLEREKVDKSIDEYKRLCSQNKFRAEKLVHEADDVAKGLVELIALHGITKLVMGAAADKYYSKKLKTPRSRTAISVLEQAEPSCKIWFVCKENLICTREAGPDGSGMSISHTFSPRAISTDQVNTLRSRSLPQGRAQLFNGLSNPALGIFEQGSRSDNFNRNGGDVIAALHGEEPFRTPGNNLSSNDTVIDLWEGVSRRSSQGSDHSSRTVAEDVSDAGPALVPHYCASEDGSAMLPSVDESEEDLRFSSPPEDMQEDVERDDEMYERLQNALAEAQSLRREAYEESCRRQKAERDAVEASQKAKASGNLLAKEVKQRKELEEALAKGRMALEELKNQQYKMFEELRIAREKKMALEIQNADSERAVKGLGEKLSAAQNLLSSLQREHAELQRERDDAIREAEALRQMRDDVVTGDYGNMNFSEFSYEELRQATCNFDSSMKIGEGGYGKVFQGLLRHTDVAVKILNPQGMQGQAEFHQEVAVLSKVRHPNLVTLIGVCPEDWALVYEFLPNGSLEDRLTRKDNTPPLTWQTRIRIAAEICSALIFLHSNKPHSIVHGDLKPSNILLDANLVSKLGDFGICRFLIHSNTTSTFFHETQPKGTFVYMDPEFLTSGQLTSQSDVYSFGVILLRLLTGRPGLGLITDVQEAMTESHLHSILDASAGNWPFVQAKQLAHLALRCCAMSRKSRPDLVGEVWKVLEPMAKAAAPIGSSSSSASEDESRIPFYFMCPIFQEIMSDPHIAADGFTYEGEAIKGWLDSGHDTSPMTNLRLAHCELIPNRTLRSAIQEWQQH